MINSVGARSKRQRWKSGRTNPKGARRGGRAGGPLAVARALHCSCRRRRPLSSAASSPRGARPTGGGGGARSRGWVPRGGGGEAGDGGGGGEIAGGRGARRTSREKTWSREWDGNLVYEFVLRERASERVTADPGCRNWLESLARGQWKLETWLRFPRFGCDLWKKLGRRGGGLEGSR